MKFKCLLISAIILMALASCGNDKEVEAKFIAQVNKATQQLTAATTVDDLVLAQDMLDAAYNIEGVDDLSESDAVEEAVGNFDKQLDKARERMMDRLGQEFLADPDAPADSIQEK